MLINIEAHYDKEWDGLEGSVRISRDNVETLQDIANAVKSFLLGAGFTYVEDVGFSKDDGSMVWGETL
jgi:hypothetical protein